MQMCSFAFSWHAGHFIVNVDLSMEGFRFLKRVFDFNVQVSLDLRNADLGFEYADEDRSEGSWFLDYAGWLEYAVVWI
jgi:hypothetical protein